MSDWIAYSDRTPKEREDCLVACKDSKGRWYVGAARHHPREGYAYWTQSAGSWEVSPEVDLWMPLPEPPSD